MAKPFKKALTISTCMLVAVALTIGAVAWFAGYKDIGNLGFQTGSNARLPQMRMWMYYSANDGATGLETDTEGWLEQETVTDPSGKNEYIVIPGPGEETETQLDTNGDVVVDGNGDPVYLYSYEIPKLHFGKVDNLVTLKNDNKVLLRFYFDQSMLNNPDGIVHYVAFTLAYNTEGYTYEQNAVSVLDSIHLMKEVSGGAQEVDLRQDQGGGKHVLEYRTDEPRAMQFIQIRYAVSTEGFEPGENGFDGIDGLTFHDDIVPINCGSAGMLTDQPKTQEVTDANGNKVITEVTDEEGNVVFKPVCEACEKGTCGQARLDDDDLSSIMTKSGENYVIGSGGFYVYIELAPLLDAFGMQENILDYFVPAYMLFDVKLDVEIG